MAFRTRPALCVAVCLLALAALAALAPSAGACMNANPEGVHHCYALLDVQPHPSVWYQGVAATITPDVMSVQNPWNGATNAEMWAGFADGGWVESGAHYGVREPGVDYCTSTSYYGRTDGVQFFWAEEHLVNGHWCYKEHFLDGVQATMGQPFKVQLNYVGSGQWRTEVVSVPGNQVIYWGISQDEPSAANNTQVGMEMWPNQVRTTGTATSLWYQTANGPWRSGGWPLAVPYVNASNGARIRMLSEKHGATPWWMWWSTAGF